MARPAKVAFSSASSAVPSTRRESSDQSLTARERSARSEVLEEARQAEAGFERDAQGYALQDPSARVPTLPPWGSLFDGSAPDAVDAPTWAEQGDAPDSDADADGPAQTWQAAFEKGAAAGPQAAAAYPSSGLTATLAPDATQSLGEPGASAREPWTLSAEQNDEAGGAAPNADSSSTGHAAQAGQRVAMVPPATPSTDSKPPFAAAQSGSAATEAYARVSAQADLLLPSEPPSPSPRPPARAQPTEQLTVIVNTFKRLELLQRFVAHYALCPTVARIHVVWAESNVAPMLSDYIGIEYFLRGGGLTFALPGFTHNDRSLNARFLPVPGAHTASCLVRAHFAALCARMACTISSRAMQL